MEKSTDHVTRAKQKILYQFREDPTISALVEVRARRSQELETAAWEVAEGILDLEGEGFVLDTIGRILKCGREGLTDAAYRWALRAWARALRSKSRLSDLREVGVLSSGRTLTFQIRTYGYSTIVIRILEALPLAENLAPLERNYREIRPLGARQFLVYEFPGGARYGSVYSPAVGTPTGWTDNPALGLGVASVVSFPS